MMSERHYDEEALITLLERDRHADDPHLSACEPCSETLESFRLISDALHDQNVWDKREVRTEAIPATIANLRAFADRMTNEDTHAEAVLTELLAGPREEWMPRLREHPEWRTAGVVRKLIAATDRAIDTMPPDAVEMTSMATDIAEGLDATAHPAGTISRLRGAAWRERAYALFYTGQYPAAEKAVTRSQTCFEACVVADYDLARLGIVSALVSRAFERHLEARAVARSSSTTFSLFNDARRAISSRLTEVQLLFSCGDWVSAEHILHDLELQVRDSDDPHLHARILSNLAYCYRRLGRIEPAIRFYDLATTLYEELGVETDATRNRWSSAAMLVEGGRFEDGLLRLRRVHAEFERLGMISVAALAALDIAEVLLNERRFDEVEEICRASMAAFERAGLSYTARALTAIAFICEAAAQRTADRALIRGVRDYIERLPAQPQLLFAPPPG
jgi:tetratricopeptide (TPR) repeat protein